MECIDTKTYICPKCGYITNIKPFNFPECPVCESSNIIYSNNTKEIK